MRRPLLESDHDDGDTAASGSDAAATVTGTDASGPALVFHTTEGEELRLTQDDLMLVLTVLELAMLAAVIYGEFFHE